jgi:hypothetical protein
VARLAALTRATHASWRKGRPRHVDNKNPGAVFDGASFELSDSAAERVDEALAAVRSFVEAHGVAPTAELWVAAGMSPSEHTIRRRFGSFKAAVATALNDWK